MRVLVVGYGSPVRRDDGVGQRVAEALAAELGAEQASGDVEVIASVQLTLELAEALSRAERALFIDCRAGGESGTLSLEPLTPETGDGGGLSHHLDAGTLLRTASELYGRAPEAALLSIHGADFGFGEELSEVVAAVLPRAVERARNLVREWLRG